MQVDMEETTTVYRVEHRSKRRWGPYRRRTASMPKKLLNLANWLCERHSDEQHPTPSEDGGNFYLKRTDFFGFSSEESMKHWFNEYERLVLDRGGFTLAVYQVPLKAFTWEGKKSGQVAFQRSKSVLVEKRSLI